MNDELIPVSQEYLDANGRLIDKLRDERDVLGAAAILLLNLFIKYVDKEAVDKEEVRSVVRALALLKDLGEA